VIKNTELLESLRLIGPEGFSIAGGCEDIHLDPGAGVKSRTDVEIAAFALCDMESLPGGNVTTALYVSK
jgi:hypothetical protein